MNQSKLVWMLFALLFPIIACAQNVFEYTYDGVGNRIKRRVIVLVKSESVKDTTKFNNNLLLQDKNTIKEKLGSNSVLVYPNPTKGTLLVKMEGDGLKGLVEVSLFDMKGTLAGRYSFNSLLFEIDLSRKPSGMYILMMRIGGGDVTSWKIVKE